MLFSDVVDVAQIHRTDSGTPTIEIVIKMMIFFF